MQLDKQDRQAKLEETFQSVVADYKRILGHVLLASLMRLF